MKTLLLLATLSACASRVPDQADRVVNSLPQETVETLPSKDAIKCQVKAFNFALSILDNESIYKHHKNSEVKGFVKELKRQALHCYRTKSDTEVIIDQINNVVTE